MLGEGLTLHTRFHSGVLLLCRTTHLEIYVTRSKLSSGEESETSPGGSPITSECGLGLERSA